MNAPITGVQAWDTQGQMWGIDPAQVPAAQANPSVVRIRITYADGAQVEAKPNSRDPTVANQR